MVKVVGHPFSTISIIQSWGPSPGTFSRGGRLPSLALNQLCPFLCSFSKVERDFLCSALFVSCALLYPPSHEKSKKERTDNIPIFSICIHRVWTPALYSVHNTTRRRKNQPGGSRSPRPAVHEHKKFPASGAAALAG